MITKEKLEQFINEHCHITDRVVLQWTKEKQEKWYNIMKSILETKKSQTKQNVAQEITSNLQKRKFESICLDETKVELNKGVTVYDIKK